MLSTNADAPPKTAMSHIQNTAPGPPASTAAATPMMLPDPTRDAVETIRAWKDDSAWWSFFFFSLSESTASFSRAVGRNWSRAVK